MAHAVPAPPPNPKLGWSGQTLLTMPKAGLQIVPGAGLIGRTDAAGGQLFLDASNASVAEPVHFFVPGAVSARTIGRWRNRRAKGSGTLAIMEANFLTAPTAGDGTNFWRATVTDSLGHTVQLPLSAAGKTFYDLNQLGSNKVVDVGSYAGSGSDSSSGGGSVAMIHTVVPSQPVTIGGATVWLAVVNSNTAAAVGGAPVRCTILDAAGNVLREATAFTSGTLDDTVANSGNENLVFNFDEVLQLQTGTSYYVAFDALQAFALANGYATRSFIQIASWGKVTGGVGALLPAGSVLNIDGVTPGTSPINRLAYGAVVADNSNNPFWQGAPGPVNVALVNSTTVQQLIQGTTPAGFIGAKVPSPGTHILNWQSASQPTAGAWGLLGGVSGVAPSYGDLTVALSSVGAPAAGAAGSDLNLRFVMLP